MRWLAAVLVLTACAPRPAALGYVAALRDSIRTTRDSISANEGRVAPDSIARLDALVDRLDGDLMMAQSEDQTEKARANRTQGRAW